MNKIKENSKPVIIPTPGMKLRGIDKDGKSVNFAYEELENDNKFRGWANDNSPVPAKIQNGDWVRCITAGTNVYTDFSGLSADFGNRLEYSAETETWGKHNDGFSGIVALAEDLNANGFALKNVKAGKKDGDGVNFNQLYRLSSLNTQWIKNIIDDSFSDLSVWGTSSGSGSYDYETKNGRKTLHLNDCVINTHFDISEMNLNQKWSVLFLIEDFIKTTGDLRVIIRMKTGTIASPGSVVGLYFDETISSSSSDLLQSEDGFTFDPTATIVNIYIAATGSEAWISNFSVINSDLARAIHYDKVLEEKIADSGYQNVIQNNNFINGLEGWRKGEYQGLDGAGTSVVTLENEANPFSGKTLKSIAGSATRSNNYTGVIVETPDYLKAGDTIVFRGLVKTSAAADNPYIEIRAVDSTIYGSLATVIKTDIIKDDDVWTETGDIELLLPANVKYIRVWIRYSTIGEDFKIAGWTLFKKTSEYKNLYKSSLNIRPLNQQNFYVDAVNGNDSFSGSKAEPLLTINKAIELSTFGTNPKIIVRTGTYREKLAFDRLTSLTNKITIIAPVGDKVRILASDEITGFSKTGGYTNIYEVAFTGTIPIYGGTLNKKKIFEDRNPSKLILSTEKHPLQYGLQYRLPYTELIEADFDTNLATTLAALDSTNGGFYYDTSGNKLYVVGSGNTDPSTNGFSYEYAVRDLNEEPLYEDMINMEMSNIEFYFSVNNGLVCGAFNEVRRISCRLFGSKADGFSDSSNILYSYREEVAGCGNDGFNGHYESRVGWAAEDIRAGTNHAIYFEPYAHDNHDDGMSFHSHGEMFGFGGLFEYNGDRGMAASNSCVGKVHNILFRKNGDTGLENSQGLALVNSNDPSDEKTQGSLVAFGCIFEDNPVGAGVESNAGNLLTLVNCTARNNTVANYEADYGTVIARNCKSTVDGGIHKSIINGGVITVINDADLI